MYWQARLSLLLELLGERNERIEQLELDVQVGWLSHRRCSCSLPLRCTH